MLWLLLGACCAVLSSVSGAWGDRTAVPLRGRFWSAQRTLRPWFSVRCADRAYGVVLRRVRCADRPVLAATKINTQGGAR